MELGINLGNNWESKSRNFVQVGRQVGEWCLHLTRTFSLLLLGLDEDLGVANEARVLLSQDQLHHFWVNKGHEPKHPFY